MQEPVVKVTGLQESGLIMWWTWCFHWPHEPCVCMTTPLYTLLSLKNFIFLCLNLSFLIKTALVVSFSHPSAWFEFALSEPFCSTMPPITTHSPPVDGPVSEYGITFQTHIVDKFGVSFGREGETMSLGCTVVIYPALQGYQPGIQWYRDGKQPPAIVLAWLG